MNDKELKDTYDEFGSLIPFWIHSGNKLLSASNVLKINDFHNLSIEDKCKLDEKKIGILDFFDSYQMLRGMAIECFLKAILIKKKIIVFKDGLMLKKYPKHNLELMGVDIKMPFSKDEKLVLKLLSHWIMFARYPIPSKWSGWKNLPDVQNVSPKGTGLSWNGELEKAFELILEKLGKELNDKSHS